MQTVSPSVLWTLLCIMNNTLHYYNYCIISVLSIFNVTACLLLCIINVSPHCCFICQWSHFLSVKSMSEKWELGRETRTPERQKEHKSQKEGVHWRGTKFSTVRSNESSHVKSFVHCKIRVCVWVWERVRADVPSKTEHLEKSLYCRSVIIGFSMEASIVG